MADDVDKKEQERPAKRALSKIRHVVGALADAARALEDGMMEPSVGLALNAIYKTLLEAIRDREAQKLADWKRGLVANKPKTMPGVDVRN